MNRASEIVVAVCKRFKVRPAELRHGTQVRSAVDVVDTAFGVAMLELYQAGIKPKDACDVLGREERSVRHWYTAFRRRRLAPVERPRGEVSA